jgi:hypothetical protein
VRKKGLKLYCYFKFFNFYRENRKELSEEQIRNREMKERFKMQVQFKRLYSGGTELSFYVNLPIFYVRPNEHSPVKIFAANVIPLCHIISLFFRGGEL